MTLTIVLSLIMMAGFFLMLYSAVGLVQDKRLFTSAPKEIQAAVQPKEERFAGQHLLGRHLLAVSVMLMIVPLFFGGMDGIQNGFNFIQFFVRFLIMLLAVKAFDIIFFDWVLLCHSNFFPRFYPEVKELVGPHLFGYNWKDHALHIALSFPLSLLLAWICTAVSR
ncbi:MAG: hypothetical protein Q4D71_05975 [Oscillospiraceae bacterium]|nr:hypothetical protein [Oscillospiraceae bacterium]